MRDLVKRPHTRALSAWDAGAASEGLRPSATAAMIVVSVDRSEKDVVHYDQPQIERLVARDISAPVRASVTGQPSIDRAIKNEALSSTLRSELIAVAILFVLLMLALRAPLAAAIVTVVGAATVLAAYGLMALLARFIETDPIAVALASMTGLALGVGYSLLILDRFHQQEGSPTPTRATPARGLDRGRDDRTRPAVRRHRPDPRAAARHRDRPHEDPRLARHRRAALLHARARRRRRRDARRARAVRAPPGHRRPRRAGGAHARLGSPRRRGLVVRHRAVVAGALATAALLALAVPALSLATGPPASASCPPPTPRASPSKRSRG